jgi:hypothetical protein
VSELELEMYEDMMIRKEELIAIIENGHRYSREQRQAYSDELAEINRSLGDDCTEEDPLIAEWEQDIKEGRTPDLDKDMPRG